MWYLLIFIVLVVLAYIFYQKTYLGGGLEDLPSDILYIIMERAEISAQDHANVLEASKLLFQRLITADRAKPLLEKSKEEQVFIKNIRSNPNVIKNIENPSEAVQFAALKINPTLIEFIKNPTDDVKRYVVKTYPHALKRYPKAFGEHPSQELVDIAKQANIGTFVDDDGSQHWLDRIGKRHREDGPASILANGAQFWFKNGKIHREDGPAVIYPDGTQKWYINGNLHREDGPAYIYPDGRQEWYKNGKFHREDGPA